MIILSSALRLLSLACFILFLGAACYESWFRSPMNVERYRRALAAGLLFLGLYLALPDHP